MKESAGPYFGPRGLPTENEIERKMSPVDVSSPTLPMGEKWGRPQYGNTREGSRVITALYSKPVAIEDTYDTEAASSTGIRRRGVLAPVRVFRRIEGPVAEGFAALANWRAKLNAHNEMLRR